ncbi:elongation factor Ts, mitochondrial [Trifolium repens]|nr:elongation factor Ts, mitochondrial [Trifolium repens]
MVVGENFTSDYGLASAPFCRRRELNLGEKKTYKSFSISPQIPFTHLRNPKLLFIFRSTLSLLSPFFFLSPASALTIITEPSSTVKTSAQVEAFGKSQYMIIDKMVEGCLHKYFEDFVVMDQMFVMNDTMKVKNSERAIVDSGLI